MENRKKTKRTFWTIAAFYGLIAFEFFYMASPFALYFYGAYQPGLSFLNDIPGLSWLASFFLPHIVLDTKSTLINTHNIVGASIAFLGFLLFCYGAIQVYYSKLFKKGAVLGGLYKIIRHPQYTSFALCSFGLLLLWPRFLVLAMFITLLFGYYFLAKVEERECEEKFGDSYIKYKNSTNMFLPFKFKIAGKLFYSLQNKIGKGFSFVMLYFFLLGISLGVAKVIQVYSIDNLYTLENDNSLFLSITKIEQNRFESLTQLVLSDSTVIEKLKKAPTNSEFLLNYVVPTDIYISEIPMNYLTNDKYVARNHFMNLSDKETNNYKVIFTIATSPIGKSNDYKSIFSNPTLVIPIIEVWLDLEKKKVTDIMAPPISKRYEEIPVPVF